MFEQYLLFESSTSTERFCQPSKRPDAPKTLVLAASAAVSTRKELHEGAAFGQLFYPECPERTTSVRRWVQAAPQGSNLFTSNPNTGKHFQAADDSNSQSSEDKQSGDHQSPVRLRRLQDGVTHFHRLRLSEEIAFIPAKVAVRLAALRCGGGGAESPGSRRMVAGSRVSAPSAPSCYRHNSCQGLFGAGRRAALDTSPRR